MRMWLVALAAAVVGARALQAPGTNDRGKSLFISSQVTQSLGYMDLRRHTPPCAGVK
jgi:hypothetical protein